MTNYNYKHWQLSRDDAAILWLSFDRQGQSTNTIDPEVLAELKQILDTIADDETLAGLVVQSAKQKGFIAGADVKYFAKLESTEEILDFLQTGQAVFQQLENLTIPTVAVINGFSMGGGTELALACKYRIADETQTKIGLPEVLLGIQPAWGGSVRLPRLIGAIHALPMMLQGNALSARYAKKIGLVDACVPERQLIRAAKHIILTRPKQHELSFMQKLMEIKLFRRVFAKYLNYVVAKKAKPEHYPAPYKIIEGWKEYGAKGSAAYHAEINNIRYLIDKSPTTKNLLRLFFLREELKEFGKNSQDKPKHIHVIGAGVMGGDIAAWCAYSGFEVTLQDKKMKMIAPAIARAYKLFSKKFKKQSHKITAAMDRLMPDVEGIGIQHADIIIEAVFEDLKVKQELFKQLEQTAKPTAILATNTSSIPLDEINTVLENPSRLVGIHFFNPVAQMQLVEIVEGQKTDKTIMERATAFVGKINRLSLPVKSSPGFLVNRILMPYLLECMILLDEGVPAANIDKAATDFGMLMGPVELADTVGLDVCLAVAKNLSNYYGNDIPKSLTTKVEQGELGRKTGKGFYRYDKKKKPIKALAKPYDLSLETIANRLTIRMINESSACLREAVVANADLLDAGMVFGTGFAPFRGGIMHYVETLGKDELNKITSKLKESYGERFQLDEGLC